MDGDSPLERERDIEVRRMMQIQVDVTWSVSQPLSHSLLILIMLMHANEHETLRAQQWHFLGKARSSSIFIIKFIFEGAAGVAGCRCFSLLLLVVCLNSAGVRHIFSCGLYRCRCHRRRRRRRRHCC